MKASEFELLQKAISVYGAVAQTDMAIEEMGELIVAINHYRRGRVGMDAVKEEIADVMIAMKQLAMIYGESGVEIFIEKKMQRLEQRLKDKMEVQHVFYGLDGRNPQEEPQVKEFTKTQRINETCEENGNSLTYEDERIRKWIINEIKIKHHNLDEENVDFVDKAIAWLEKQGNMTERVMWKEIPKDKDGFFDENSDLYDRLPIIITEEFKDFINLYYIDKENWHETLADLSRQRFVRYIEVRELKTK